jgi:hypothetical protein
MTWQQDRRLLNLVESRQVGYANIHCYKSVTFSEIAHAFVYHRIPCGIVCAYLASVIMQCTLQWIDIFIVFIFNPCNELLQLATLSYDPTSLPDNPYITTFITTYVSAAPRAGLASRFRSKSISDIPSNFGPIEPYGASAPRESFATAVSSVIRWSLVTVNCVRHCQQIPFPPIHTGPNQKILLRRAEINF